MVYYLVAINYRVLMMASNIYKSLDFEGPDQVGKGDAVVNFSSHISSLGYSTSVISFPYYSSPFGYIIRDILVNGFPSCFFLEKDRDIQIKMALFALNRLEILNCIKLNEKFDIYVFDRGPFSNALTIAYHLFANTHNDISKKQFVKDALQYDSYFREVLDIGNCVICLRHKGIVWKGSRGKKGDDLHERKEVQDISNNIYDIFEREIGDGWKNIVTKDQNGWRSRDEIRDECLNFAFKRGVLSKKERKSRGSSVYLGIDEVQRFLYQGSLVDSGLKDSWMNAITLNDKKEVYRVSESISHALASTTERVYWGDGETVGKIKEIVHNLPEIFDIIENRYGKSFLSKFSESLE